MTAIAPSPPPSFGSKPQEAAAVVKTMSHSTSEPPKNRTWKSVLEDTTPNKPRLKIDKI